MTVAQEIDAKVVLASSLFNTAFIHTVTGRLEQAKAEHEHVLAISQAAGDVATQSIALLMSGLHCNWEGDYAEALRLESEALRLAREHNLLFPLLQNLFVRGVTLAGRGEYDDALSTLAEGLALSEKVGDEIVRHRILNAYGWIYGELGDLDRALDFNRRGAEGGRKRGDHETQANAEANLGDALLAKGELPLAGEVLEGVHRLVTDPATSEWQKWRYSIHLYASLGELALAEGDLERALALARECLERATRTNSRRYIARGSRLLGEIALNRRQWEEAERALGEALSIAQAIGNPTQLWKTHVALGQLHDAMKRPDAARGAYAAAREVINGMRNRLEHPELKACLGRAAFVQRIVDLSAPR